MNSEGGSSENAPLLPSIEQSNTFSMKRLRYYVPILAWLPNYTINNFKSDMIAGLSVAFLLIPQSLSFAQGIVKIPPVYGLYTSFISEFIYGIFGMSRFYH
jgi:MFS superfamily sulfate permease-like transporter